MSAGSEASLRAVLWDLDGTLVDSAEQHWQSWQEALAAKGFSVTHAQFRGTFGQRNDAILARWLGEGVPIDVRHEIGVTKEARYRELVARDGLTPLPGAAEWVTRLAADGWKQAVASSAPRLNVEVVVEALGLGAYFAALTAAEDVTHGKPAPDVFLAAAERVGVPPAQCVVVEDAAAGVQAAVSAGMRCIGVGGPALAKADLVVGSLAELSEGSFARLLSPG